MVVALLAAAVLAFSMMQSLVFPVLPAIQEGLGASQQATSWVVTAFLLSAAVFTPLMGRLGDLWGKRLMLVVSLSAIAVGCVGAAVTDNVVVMIAARAVQGVGGGVMPLAFGLAREHMPPRRVAPTIGMLASVGGVGSAVGLVVSGGIVEAWGYHWLFWLPAIATSLVAGATIRYLPTSARHPARVSWWPAVLMAATLVSFLLGVSSGPSRGWTSASVIGLLVASIPLGVWWALSELRSDAPLIDLRILVRPSVRGANLIALLMGADMYAVYSFVPQLIQAPDGSGYGLALSTVACGLVMLSLAGSFFATGLSSDALLRRLGTRTTLVLASAALIVSLVGLATWTDQLLLLLLLLVLQGFGMSLLMVAPTHIVLRNVRPSETGQAAGMNGNLRILGGSIGCAVFASILAAGAPADALPGHRGYTLAFLFLAATMIPALLIGAATPADADRGPEETDGRDETAAEIAETLRRYARALDSRDWPLLASCFTPAATVTFEGFSEYEGRDAVVAGCRASLARFSETEHRIDNCVVQVDPAATSATTTCDVVATHVRNVPGHDTAKCFTIGGRYVDRLVRSGGAWLIADRVLEVTWQDGDPSTMR